MEGADQGVHEETMSWKGLAVWVSIQMHMFVDKQTNLRVRFMLFSNQSPWPYDMLAVPLEEEQEKPGEDTAPGEAVVPSAKPCQPPASPREQALEYCSSWACKLPHLYAGKGTVILPVF